MPYLFPDGLVFPDHATNERVIPIIRGYMGLSPTSESFAETAREPLGDGTKPLPLTPT